MAITLKDILGAVLSDTIRAQHDTNSFLSVLQEQYAQGGRLAGLKVPQASVGELTMTFNYAVTGGIEEKEEEGVNDRSVEKSLRYICNEASTLLIKTLVHNIQNSKADYKGQYAFIDNLPANKEFIRHLRRRFLALLTENMEMILTPKAKLKEDAIRRLLLVTAEEQLLDHEDLRGLFIRQDATGLRESISNEFTRVLEKELDDIMRESSMQSFRRIQRYGSLNVEIDDTKLAQLPPSSVKTMTITVRPATQDIDIKNNPQ